MAETAKPKKKTTARTPTEKAAAFNELATARVNKALKAMRQIKYLTNPTTYNYTKEQAQTIITALTKGLHEVTASFANPSEAKSEGFKLG
jgi:hypothetical protein